MKRRDNGQALMQSLEGRSMMAADLYVAAVNVEAAVIGSDETIGSSIVLTNRGNSAVNSTVSVRLVYSKNKVFGDTDDMPLGTVRTTAGIAAGATELINVSPRRPSGLQGGEFYIGAFVDPFNNIIEKQEANNVTFSTNIVTHYSWISQIRTNNILVGTSRDDVIELSIKSDKLLVNYNGTIFGDDASKYQVIRIDAGAGNDVVTATADFPIKLAATGSSGDDVLIGGMMDDELSGANGRDRVFGAGGNDLVLGGGGNDRLYGDAGNDLMAGSGGIDLLFGGEGANTLYGGAGNDRFTTNANNAVDHLFGGDGTDSALADPNDVLDAVEA